MRIQKAAQISEPRAKAIAHAIKDAEREIAQDVRSILDERLSIVATKADLADLGTEMAEMKAELLRGMFIFWAGQVVATIGIVATALKLVK